MQMGRWNGNWAGRKLGMLWLAVWCRWNAPISQTAYGMGKRRGRCAGRLHRPLQFKPTQRSGRMTPSRSKLRTEQDCIPRIVPVGFLPVPYWYPSVKHWQVLVKRFERRECNARIIQCCGAERSSEQPTQCALHDQLGIKHSSPLVITGSVVLPTAIFVFP